MTRLYSDADLWNAEMQRRRLLGIYLAVAGAYAAAFVGLVVYYALLPYKDPNGTWVIVVTSVLTALFIAFSFPYMGISYSRSRAYCRMLRFISTGLKEYSRAPYLGVDDWRTHDGVDVNVALFSVKNIKRDEPMTRQIYIDGEKEYPPFEEGRVVRFVSQGNLMIEYEVEE